MQQAVIVERPTMQQAVIVERPTMERAVIVDRPGLPPRTPVTRPGMTAREGLNLPGLGLGVIALPAGYDPSNPNAGRARPAPGAPGQRWTPPGPGRRDVRGDGRGDMRGDPRQPRPDGAPPAPGQPQQPQQPLPTSDPRRKARSKERAEVVLDEKLRRSTKPRAGVALQRGPKPPIKRKVRIDGEITLDRVLTLARPAR